MRRLMLLRHAKADRPSGIGDHERPLADRGRRDSARMGAYMAAAGLVPDLAIVSSARRAQETWTVARPAFAADIAQRDDRRIYEASAAALARAIGDTGADTATLLLVGHNPGFHQLALQLAGSGNLPDLARLHREYPTAGLVVIDFGHKAGASCRKVRVGWNCSRRRNRSGMSRTWSDGVLLGPLAAAGGTGPLAALALRPAPPRESN